MPGRGHQTACDFELRESTPRGALFGNSRSGRRAAVIILALGSGLGAALIYQLIVARSVPLKVSFGVGVAFSAVWSIGLLWRMLTRLELRTDRDGGKVTLRKRPPFSSWTLAWELDSSGADYITLAHDRSVRTVTLTLRDGRQMRLDEGVQREALEALAKELAETLRCPIREL